MIFFFRSFFCIIKIKREKGAKVRRLPLFLYCNGFKIFAVSFMMKRNGSFVLKKVDGPGRVAERDRLDRSWNGRERIVRGRVDEQANPFLT